MSLMETGVIRLATLDGDGDKLLTYYLPAPSMDGLELEWEEQSSTVTLATGGRRTRRVGFVPTLTVRWKLYDERTGQGYSIGIGDGERPTLEQLLVILSQATNTLKVSPGPAAGGFVVDQVVVKPIGKKGPYYTGLQAAFHGRVSTDTRTLGTF